MRFSTSARHRHGSRARSGPVGRTAMLRVAAGMLGLALVGSVGAGAVASSPDTVDLPAAAAEATPAATETTPAVATTPAAEQLPAEDASTLAAPAEEAAKDGEAAVEAVAPTKAAPEAPAIDAAPKTPAALALKEAPAIQALAAEKPQLTCSSGVVYTLDTGGTIRRVNTSSGGQTDIGGFTGESLPNLNGFALTKDAKYAYAARASATNSGDMTVYRYNSGSGKTDSFPGVQKLTNNGGTFVMGGINPKTGIYYYGRVLNSRLELYAFDTNPTGTTVVGNIGYVGHIAVTKDSGVWRGGFWGGYWDPAPTERANGDLVFSSDGAMYFVASSGTSATDASVLMRVTNPLPVAPVASNSPALSATTIKPLAVNTDPIAFNGIAFEGGFLYLDSARSGTNNGGDLYKVDPSTGVIADKTQLMDGRPVDMASCQYNNTLQVQKNIVSRVASTDQFKLTASVGTTEIGASGTTTGISTDLQTGEGNFASSVPISGTTITIKEAGVAGTNLAQYTSSWVCRSADGAWTKKSEDGTSSTSGTFEFPAQSNAGVNVTCVFTNKPLSANVKVTKTWVDAVAGDSASFKANAETGTSTVPADGNVITTSFAQGTTVNVSEVLKLANKGIYSTVLKCTNAAGTTVAEGTLTGSFVLGQSDVTCAYTNTNTAATVVVKKKWIVDDIAYDNGEQPTGIGEQPEGISAALTLTGPGTDGATGQEWAAVRPGYFAGNTVTIAETTTFEPGMKCELRSSAITPANGTTTSSTVPYSAVLVAGANSYTITNTVKCTTVLTLLKFIDDSNGGSLVPGDFTLTATPEVGNALNFDGANTVTAANTKPVVASVNHALSESSADKPAYLQLSLQRYTGIFNTDGSLADAEAWEDAAATNVSVATGHHEVYRFVNASVPTMTLPLTGGTGSIAYLMVGGGILLLALLVTAWILVRRGKANRA